MRLLLLALLHAASALTLPPLSAASRRTVVGAAFAAAVSPLRAEAEDEPVVADPPPPPPAPPPPPPPPPPIPGAKVVPKNKVGVTPGGVKYFDKEGGSCSPFNPCTPQQGDIVKIKYKSYLSNGQMFDSSEGPGRRPLAAKFKADPPQLLPGWEEALETMEQGATRIIQVPPSLAYGDKGLKVETKDGEEFLVPPGEKLQFELTLVQVSLPPP